MASGSAVATSRRIESGPPVRLIPFPTYLLLRKKLTGPACTEALSELEEAEA